MIKQSVTKFSLLAIFLAVTLVFTNCTKEDSIEIDSSEDSFLTELINSLENSEIIDSEDLTRGSSKSSFSTLRAALKCTGLSGILKDRNLTLFAPNDEAFGKLGLTADNICDAFDAETLANILAYHVYGERILVVRPGSLGMLNGSPANITSKPKTLRGPYYKRYLINNARLIARGGCRGIKTFTINQVLLPPSANIVETAMGADMFATLVEAVLAADPGVAEALSAAGAGVTVFAPTNEAFGDLLATLGLETLEDVVGAIGVDGLTAILQYHVVPAIAYSTDLSDGAEIPTLQGETLTVDLENLGITDKTGTNANLVIDGLDIATSNGLVHTIDKVLLPQQILDAL